MVFTTIYALACSETVWYVGSTTKPTMREREHRRSCEKSNSKNIPKDVVWEFVILEQTEMNDWLRKDTERFYIEFLEPRCNKQLPGRSQREGIKMWQVANRDRYNESQRRCYAARKNLTPI